MFSSFYEGSYWSGVTIFGLKIVEGVTKVLAAFSDGFAGI